MAELEYALPLCDHSIRASQFFDSEWVKCECGIFYNKSTLNNYRDALRDLANADRRASIIENFAATQDRTYREGGATIAPTARPSYDSDYSVAANSAAPTATGAPASWFPSSGASAPVATGTQGAPVAGTQVTTGAPVRTAPVRPRRELPKLTPQQTLLAIAAALTLISATIFFSTTWTAPWFGLPLKALVLVSLVSLTAFGSIKSKKYFVIISNFLAALSSGFIVLGLTYAGSQGLLESFWPDTTGPGSVYMPLVWLAASAYSLGLGRRFKVFGWLAFTPVAFAVSMFYLVVGPIQNWLSGSDWASGVSATVLSLAMLLTVAVGRLTRIPAPEKPKETSGKSKKAPTEDEAKAKQEATYNFELHEREQKALTLIYRICVGVLTAVFGFQMLQAVVTYLTGGGLAVMFGGPVLPAPLSLLMVGLFWIAASVLIELRGAPFTVVGSVAHWVKVVAWQIAFNVTAFSLLAMILDSQQAAASAPDLVAVLADAALGAALLFVVPNKLGEKFEASGFAAIIAAAQSWALFAVLTPWGDQLTSTGAIWLSLVALALFAKAWIAKLSTLGLASLITGNVAAMLPLFKGNAGQYLPGSPSANLVVVALVSIALAVLWFFASQRMFARVSPERSPIANFSLLATQVLTVVVVQVQWTFTARDLAAEATAQLWPVLALALVMGLVFVVATRTNLASDDQTANVFSGSGLAWLLVGLGTLTVTADFKVESLIWTLYSLAAFAVGLFFTAKRNHLAGVLISLGFGAVLSAAIGTWTVALYPSTHILNPLGFLASAVAVTIVLRRVSKVDALSFTYASVGLYVLMWAAYAPLRVQEIQPADALSNSLWATLVLLAAGAAASLLRLRESFAASAFFAIYLRLVGQISLFAALLAGASVLGERQSLWLIALTLAVATAVHFITARVEKTRTWFTATYALALSTVMAVQAAIVGSIAGDLMATWFQVLIPVSMLMAFVLHQVIGAAARKAEVDLGWVSLPIATVGSAVLAFATPVFTALYSTLTPAIQNSADVWLAVAAYAVLAVVQLGYRLRFETGSAEARATQSVAILGLVLGVVAIGTITNARIWLTFVMGYISQDQANALIASAISTATWAVVTLLSVHAIMQFAQTIVKSELRTNLYGFVLSIGAVWLAVFESTKNAGLQLTEYFSLSAVAIAVVVTWLFKRADAELDLKRWWLAFPVAFGLGSLVGMFTQRQPLTVQGWVQLAVAGALGMVVLFLSRTSLSRTRAGLEVPLLVVAGLSSLAALKVALANMSDPDLVKPQLIALTLTWFASALAYAVLESSRIALIASYATGIISGLIAGDLLTQATSFAGYELNTIPVAVAVVIATVVARRLQMVPQRLVTVLPIAVPALIVLVPSTVYSWFTITKPVLTLDSLQLSRVLGLLIIGIGMFVVGIRIGNLGVTISGAVPLALTLLPNIWYRLEDAIGDEKVRFETRAIYIALVVYAILKVIIQMRGWNPRTILYIGVPVAIGLGPALVNTLTSLSRTEWAQDDWVRFAIVLSGSLVLLVIGAFRQIGGFFGPGAVGVLLAALPFAWKELSGQSWFVWVTLVLVAALLVLVAIRLEQFKSGTRSAAKWMRELR